ncbi:MAG: PAS domain S-box protein [Bacteroidales bacterium]|nr:PAS domain S-box protein [Bacteroidales bacterium]
MNDQKDRLILENKSLRRELEDSQKVQEILKKKIAELAGADLLREELVREQMQELESNTTKLAREIVDRRQCDAALKESDRKFREIVQNIPGMVFQLRIHTDGSNNFTYVSPRANEIFGINGNFTNPAWDFSTYIHRNDRAGFCLSLAKASLTESWDYKGRIIGSSGEIKWFHGIASTSRIGMEIVIDGLLMDITEKKLTEDAQLFLIESEWTDTGEDFFLSLARYLAINLEMDYVRIDRLLDSNLSAETMAVFFKDHFEDNYSYKLKDTPCGDVVGKSVCYFPSGVRRLFPNDGLLQELVAESYIGTTLWSSNGAPIGLIAVIGRRPLTDPQFAESMLKTISLRAAGELERREEYEKLRFSLTKYEVLFESFPLAVTLTDEQGNIIESNRKAKQLLGKPRNRHPVRKIESPPWTLFRPDGTILPSDEYASVKALKENCMVENNNIGILRDGEKITWLKVTAAPVPLSGYGIVITYEDVSDR